MVVRIAITSADKEQQPVGTQNPAVSATRWRPTPPYGHSFQANPVLFADIPEIPPLRFPKGTNRRVAQCSDKVGTFVAKWIERDGS